MAKITFIINYPIMVSIGGIEKYIYYLMKYLIECDVRVIWMKNKKFPVSEMFIDVIEDPRLEIVQVESNYLYWFKHEDLHLTVDEDIILFSCTTTGMIKAESILRAFPELNIKSIYGIPDTKGDAYYLETIFCNPIKSLVYRCMKSVFDLWNKNNQLVFFAEKQVDALENNYHIQVEDGQSKVLKSVEPIPELDYTVLDERVKRKPFTIVSIGRFDFPHKGYLLGLIQSFGRLKVKYPQLKLDIVGDGPHKSKVLEEIQKLDEHVRRDIHLLGSIPPDTLTDAIKHAHLNISVAGGVTVGSMNGIASVSARNYCEGECEVYGYAPEYLEYCVCTSPGHLVDPYIEEVIAMSDADYRKLCVDSYERAVKIEQYEPDFIIKHALTTASGMIPSAKLRFLILIDYLKKFKYFFTVYLRGRLNRIS